MKLSLLRTPQRIFQKLVGLCEREGMMGLLQKGLDEAFRRGLQGSVNSVVWLEVDAIAEDLKPDGRFEFRFLDADEVSHFAQDSAYYLAPEMAERIRAGRDLCFAALDGDRLAAFGWYALEAIEPEHADGVAISYPPNTAFMYFGFTHPDYRGARLHGLTMALALKELASRRVTRLVSLVAWTNRASLKSCYRLGYRRLGAMIVAGNGAVGMYPGSAKALGVRFGRAAARRGA